MECGKFHIIITSYPTISDASPWMVPFDVLGIALASLGGSVHGHHGHILPRLDVSRLVKLIGKPS